jgi:hypothetical protein
MGSRSHSRPPRPNPGPAFRPLVRSAIYRFPHPFSFRYPRDKTDKDIRVWGFQIEEFFRALVLGQDPDNEGRFVRLGIAELDS